MKNMLFQACGILIAVLAFSNESHSLECPEIPKQISTDVDANINIAVGSLGKAKAGDISGKATTVTRDLLGKLPGANVVYLEQMMYATYCSSLRDSKISEEEKSKRLLDAATGVRAAVKGISPSVGKTESPRPVRSTQASGDSADNISWLNSAATIHGTYQQLVDAGQAPRWVTSKWTINSTWRELVGLVTPFLIRSPEDTWLRLQLAEMLSQRNGYIKRDNSFANPDIDEYDWQSIIIKFRSSGIAKIEMAESTTDEMFLFWNETTKGVRIMHDIRGNSIK